MTPPLLQLSSKKRAFLIAGVGAVYALYFALVYLYAPRTNGIDQSLASLAEPELSRRYDSAYWDRKRRAESMLWREALSFCGNDETRSRPNCLIVEAVEKAGSGKQVADSKIREPADVGSEASGHQRAEVAGGFPKERTLTAAGREP